MGQLELIIETEKVCFFSPKLNGEVLTEFEMFMTSCRTLTHYQLRKSFEAILVSLERMQETGAMERYFRPEGGRLKAIPLCVNIPRVNKKVGKLRLYCIWVSEKILILGNGAVTLFQKYEDDPNLMRSINVLRLIEKELKEKIQKARISYDDYDEIKQIISSITL